MLGSKQEVTGKLEKNRLALALIKEITGSKSIYSK